MQCRSSVTQMGRKRQPRQTHGAWKHGKGLSHPGDRGVDQMRPTEACELVAPDVFPVENRGAPPCLCLSLPASFHVHFSATLKNYTTEQNKTISPNPSNPSDLRQEKTHDEYVNTSKFPKAISSAGESCMYTKARQDLRSHTPEKKKMRLFHCISHSSVGGQVQCNF